MYINLHSGLQDVAYLGERESSVTARKWRKKEIDVSHEAKAKQAGLSKGLEFPDLGVRVFFERGIVTLIEVQEPFPGYLRGKREPLFSFSTPEGDSWRDSLMKQFGAPASEAEGGRLGSNALFYGWGDVAYNRMGPNQLALYRKPEIASYRKRNFGRIVKIFGK